MSNTCPKCGADYNGRPAPNQHDYWCGSTTWGDGDFYQSPECVRRERDQLVERIKRLEKVLPGIVQLEKLPDLILSGTVSDTIHAFTLMQEKKAEKKVGLLCDALDSAWALIANVDEGEWDKQQTRGWIECATKWRTDQLTPAWKFVIEHRKEAKP